MAGANRLHDARELFRNERYGEALTAARALIADQPGNANAWLLLGQIARKQGDDVTAFRAFKKAHRLDDRSGRALTLIVSLLQARQHTRAAHAFADRLAAIDDTKPHAAHALSTSLIQRGRLDEADAIVARAEAAGHEAGALERNRAVLRALAAEPAALPQAARHIAIGGSNFVGSTTFGTILGSAPGAAFAGETHWLVDPNHEESVVGCRCCGLGCPVFTPQFRDEMLKLPPGFYGRVAERMKTRILVTSDKYFGHYWRRDPWLRFDTVIIYKSPEAQMRSLVKRQLQRGDLAAPSDIMPKLPKLLSGWSANYLAFLNQTPASCRRVVMSWERFIAEPERHLRRLGELLNLPIAEDQHHRIAAPHQLGGNKNVDVKAISESGRIDLRPSNAPELPPEANAVIAAHKGARFAASVLDRAYRRDFPL